MLNLNVVSRCFQNAMNKRCMSYACTYHSILINVYVHIFTYIYIIYIFAYIYVHIYIYINIITGPFVRLRKSFGLHDAATAKVHR